MHPVGSSTDREVWPLDAAAALMSTSCVTPDGAQPARVGATFPCWDNPPSSTSPKDTTEFAAMTMHGPGATTGVNDPLALAASPTTINCTVSTNEETVTGPEYVNDAVKSMRQAGWGRRVLTTAVVPARAGVTVNSVSMQSGTTVIV